MKILNLYAGIGGNRKLWGNSHDIIAIENNPEIAKIYSDFFPDDKMIIADAHQYLLEHFKEFDFIWSSPPCQSHSIMVKATRNFKARYPILDLYQQIIFLQHFFKGKWVVENVKPYYMPLINPSIEIDRHLFWCNFRINKIKISKPKNFIKATKKELMRYYDIYYEENICYDGNHEPAQILRNIVHPEIGLHILNRALEIKEADKYNQSKLF